MSNAINFKVFLREDKNCEIRRFSVDASVVTSFLFMKEKLLSVFPALREAEFKITWKDIDGDEITVTSDEDLITAFTEMSGEIKNLFLTVVSRNSNPDVVIEGEIYNPFRHSRVICDICNQTIVGFRYKCMQCPDYDLCGNCEHQGHHGDHIMMRVPHGESLVPKCARKLMHHVSRSIRKTATSASKEAHRAAKYCSKTYGPKDNSQREEPTEKPGPSKENEEKCPFSEEINLNDFHTLGAMARQHLGPILEAMAPQGEAPTDGGALLDFIRNTVDNFLGKANQTEVPTAKPTEEAQPTEPAPTAPMDVEETATKVYPDLPKDAPKPAEPGWIVIDEGQKQANESPTNAPPPQHENSPIAQGLAQLHEMGFSNENGILSILLERHRGNVEQVVKAIVEGKF